MSICPSSEKEVNKGRDVMYLRIHAISAAVVYDRTIRW
nr:MAG TPA: hypothetical protein [Caudoviricetes sp.]